MIMFPSMDTGYDAKGVGFQVRIMLPSMAQGMMLTG